MAWAIGTDVLSFGRVCIPVDIHSAIEVHAIHFHLLHKKCGSRVCNQMFCPVCKVVVEGRSTATKTARKQRKA
jgi:DNA end-binding protein Ku